MAGRGRAVAAAAAATGPGAARMQFPKDISLSFAEMAEDGPESPVGPLLTSMIEDEGERPKRGSRSNLGRAEPVGPKAPSSLQVEEAVPAAREAPSLSPLRPPLRTPEATRQGNRSALALDWHRPEDGGSVACAAELSSHASSDSVRLEREGSEDSTASGTPKGLSRSMRSSSMTGATAAAIILAASHMRSPKAGPMSSAEDGEGDLSLQHRSLSVPRQAPPAALQAQVAAAAASTGAAEEEGEADRDPLHQGLGKPNLGVRSFQKSKSGQVDPHSNDGSAKHGQSPSGAEGSNPGIAKASPSLKARGESRDEKFEFVPLALNSSAEQEALPQEQRRGHAKAGAEAEVAERAGLHSTQSTSSVGSSLASGKGESWEEEYSVERELERERQRELRRRQEDRQRGGEQRRQEGLMRGQPARRTLSQQGSAAAGGAQWGGAEGGEGEEGADVPLRRSHSAYWDKGDPEARAIRGGPDADAAAAVEEMEAAMGYRRGGTSSLVTTPRGGVGAGRAAAAAGGYRRRLEGFEDAVAKPGAKGGPGGGRRLAAFGDSSAGRTSVGRQRRAENFDAEEKAQLLKTLADQRQSPKQQFAGDARKPGSGENAAWATPKWGSGSAPSQAAAAAAAAGAAATAAAVAAAASVNARAPGRRLAGAGTGTLGPQTGPRGTGPRRTGTVTAGSSMDEEQGAALQEAREAREERPLRRTSSLLVERQKQVLSGQVDPASLMGDIVFERTKTQVASDSRRVYQRQAGEDRPGSYARRLSGSRGGEEDAARVSSYQQQQSLEREARGGHNRRLADGGGQGPSPRAGAAAQGPREGSAASRLQAARDEFLKNNAGVLGAAGAHGPMRYDRQLTGGSGDGGSSGAGWRGTGRGARGMGSEGRSVELESEEWEGRRARRTMTVASGAVPGRVSSTAEMGGAARVLSGRSMGHGPTKDEDGDEWPDPGTDWGARRGRTHTPTRPGLDSGDGWYCPGQGPGQQVGVASGPSWDGYAEEGRGVSPHGGEWDADGAPNRPPKGPGGSRATDKTPPRAGPQPGSLASARSLSPLSGEAQNMIHHAASNSGGSSIGGDDPIGGVGGANAKNRLMKQLMQSKTKGAI